MSLLFITLKSNVQRLFSETWEKKCFLTGFESLGHLTNFPSTISLLFYTHENVDMDILMYILKLDQMLVCCLELCGVEINDREQGRNMYCSLAALVCSGLHNQARHGS